MTDTAIKIAPCGCQVRTHRDFLGRVVGTILTKGEPCAKSEHTVGQTIIMPGRENARPE